MRPDWVVVINRRDRPGRYEAFRQRWAAATGGADYDIAAAVIDDDPAVGCWMSHLAVLGEPGLPGSLLVLEDDAVFSPAVSLDLPDPPSGWRLLRLGGRMRQPGLPAPGPWQPVGNIQHTHAYVARHPGELHQLVARRSTRDIGAALALGVPGHYRLTPATVGQAAGISDIDGAVRGRDQYWEGP